MTEQEQILADDHVRATIAKLNAETAKIQSETVWYPFVVVGGIFGVALAIAKFFFS